MGVGTKIKAILKEQKKTIKQLAEESGVPVNTLYSITKRDSEWVTPVVLEKVSQALSVPISAIMPDVPDVIKKSALEFAERTAAQNRALEKKRAIWTICQKTSGDVSQTKVRFTNEKLLCLQATRKVLGRLSGIPQTWKYCESFKA